MNIKPYDETYKELIVQSCSISLEQLEEILSIIPMDQRYKKDFYTITLIGIMASMGFHYKHIKDMFESTNKVLPYFEEKFFEEIRK